MTEYGVLQVKVLDDGTGLPLAGIPVSCYQPGSAWDHEALYTNSSGIVEFEGLIAGEFAQYQSNYGGYFGYVQGPSRSASIFPNQHTIRTERLAPSGSPQPEPEPEPEPEPGSGISGRAKIVFTVKNTGNAPWAGFVGVSLLNPQIVNGEWAQAISPMAPGQTASGRLYIDLPAMSAIGKVRIALWKNRSFDGVQKTTRGDFNIMEAGTGALSDQIEYEEKEIILI